MILTEEQKEKIIKYVPNGSKLIDDGDLGELLTKLDDAILDEMDEKYRINKLGVELQRLYDDIYYQNQ